MESCICSVIEILVLVPRHLPWIVQECDRVVFFSLGSHYFVPYGLVVVLCVAVYYFFLQSFLTTKWNKFFLPFTWLYYISFLMDHFAGFFNLWVTVESDKMEIVLFHGLLMSFCRRGLDACFTKGFSQAVNCSSNIINIVKFSRLFSKEISDKSITFGARCNFYKTLRDLVGH